MKNIKVYSLMILILLLIVSPSILASPQKEVQNDVDVTETVAKYNKIDAKTAKEIFDSNSDSIIIDVRTLGEFESGHIKNSINIPLDVIENSVLKDYPNLSENLYLYCRSGNRSGQAARLLVKLGYTNVYDFGGVINWPYGLVK